MMSFGAPSIDDVSQAGKWATTSYLTGLLGCALGYRREHVTELTALQGRLTYATRCDKTPTRQVDFQTANVSTDDMNEVRWTPYGWLSGRNHWEHKEYPVNRHREYLIDGHYIVAITLAGPSKYPTVDDLKQALDYPKAPLFLGRASCIPTTRIAIGVVQSPSLLDALKTYPHVYGQDTALALWPESEGRVSGDRIVQMTMDKDWSNLIHVGRRRMVEGRLPISAGR